MQTFKTMAHFICPKCGEATSSDVDVPEPDWTDAEDSGELVSEGASEIRCTKCNETFSVLVYNNAGNCTISIDNHPDVHVSADIAEYNPAGDDWLNWDFPLSPYEIFRNTREEILNLLTTHGSEDCSGLTDGSPLINRMVFAQIISALEAYLSDTLMRELERNPDALAKLIAFDRDLNEQKFSLQEINSSKSFVRDRVFYYLRDVVTYNNLPKVDFLYKTCLGIPILASRQRNALLIEAIRLRHDCVHRNGKGKDGKSIRAFTRDYVEDVADTINSVVEQIERAIRGRLPQEWEIPF